MDVADQLPADPALVAAAISEGVRFAGLKDSQRGLVERYLLMPPSEWMNCCLSSCDPCVLKIGRAVKRARDELHLPEW